MNNEWWTEPIFKDTHTPRPTSNASWTTLFMKVAQEISNMVKCSSRKVGAVIVKDRQILSCGFNGSPAGSSLCQSAVYCPRKRLGYKSGEAVHLCPAQHAERNAISGAAKHGVATKGATIYCWCTLPCQQCAGGIIAAGISKVVCLEGVAYDTMAELLFQQAGVEIEYVKENAGTFDKSSS